MLVRYDVVFVLRVGWLVLRRDINGIVRDWGRFVEVLEGVREGKLRSGGDEGEREGRCLLLRGRRNAIGQGGCSGGRNLWTVPMHREISLIDALLLVVERVCVPYLRCFESSRYVR